MKKAVVTGAGGFIGSHLVKYLKNKGYWVRGVDIKHPEFESTAADEFMLLDLRNPFTAYIATKDVDEVYGLAANMGGMGFLQKNGARILHDNAIINFNTIDAARLNEVGRYFYSSSACVYNEAKQLNTDITALKEEDAYPAYPDLAYGWEKLITERLCKYYREDYGLETRIARFHNIFGHEGSWTGGKEKAPAALCRKVAEAKLTGKDYIEIWGDGEQTRSFCFVDDCVEGIYRLTHSEYHDPVNIGSSRLISINAMADIIMNIAGIQLEKRHVEGPQGVRGRNSDNTLVNQVLGWEPSTTLEQGLTVTYNWIEDQVKKSL